MDEERDEETSRLIDKLFEDGMGSASPANGYPASLIIPNKYLNLSKNIEKLLARTIVTLPTEYHHSTPIE